MIVRRTNPNAGEWQGWALMFAVPFLPRRYMGVTLTFELWRGCAFDRLLSRRLPA